MYIIKIWMLLYTGIHKTSGTRNQQQKKPTADKNHHVDCCERVWGSFVVWRQMDQPQASVILEVAAKLLINPSTAN